VALTINSDSNTEKVKETLARVNTSLPVLLDTDGKTVSAYRAYAVPSLFLIDQQQRIYKVWRGSLENSESQLQESINFLLSSAGAR
jgi:peroxiredoxin